MNQEYIERIREIIERNQDNHFLRRLLIKAIAMDQLYSERRAGDPS